MDTRLDIVDKDTEVSVNHGYDYSPAGIDVSFEIKNLKDEETKFEEIKLEEINLEDLLHGEMGDDPEHEEELVDLLKAFVRLQRNLDELEDDEEEEKEKNKEKTANEHHIKLYLSFIFDNCQQHKQILDLIYEKNVQGILTGGILSPSSRFDKFTLEVPPDWTDDRDKGKRSKINGRNQFDVIFKLSAFNPDELLQLLSLVGDSIIVLKSHNVPIKFDLLQIAKGISEQFHLNDQGNSECGLLLDQLINVMTTNKNIAHLDAIYLLYCFNAFKSIECKKIFEMPVSLDNLKIDMLAIVNKYFSIDFKQELDIKTKTAELNEFLNRINLWQRIKLYSPCLGKLADDGNLMKWYYTEWAFLSRVKFLLSENNTVYIDIDHENKKNIIYERVYAKDKANHEIFERELSVVASHTNLAFSNNTKWHEKIIFTPECSKFLLDMNVHFDVNAVKTLVKAKNNYFFFQHACKDSNFKKANVIEEIINKIFTLAFGHLIPTDQLDSNQHLRLALNG